MLKRLKLLPIHGSPEVCLERDFFYSPDPIRIP